MVSFQCDVTGHDDAVCLQVEVTMPNGSKSILMHYDAMNNPHGQDHGLDMQIWSRDDGETWGSGSVISYPPFRNTGGLIGPSVGIQSANGTIFFSTRAGGVGWTTGRAGAQRRGARPRTRSAP